MNVKPTKTVRIFGTISIVIAVLFVGFFAIEMGTQVWVSRQLPLLLNKNPERKYNFAFEKAKIQLLKKQLIIDKIVISPFTNDSVADVALVERFIVEGTDLRKLFFHKELKTKKLLVVNPVIVMTTSNTKVAEESEQGMNTFWKDVFTRLSIADFEIENATFSIVDETAKETYFSLNHFNLNVSGFTIDTSTIKDPFPVRFKTLEAFCNNVKLRIDTISMLQVAAIHLTNSSVDIGQIELIPNMLVSDFLATNRAKNDWVNLSIDHVQLNDFSWNLEKELPFFTVSSLKLDSLYLHVMADKNQAKLNLKDKLLLAELFRGMPFSFSLDSFLITNSSVFFRNAFCQSKFTRLFVIRSYLFNWL